MSNEYLQGVSILPWHNIENKRKAVIAAMNAENHLETMALHEYSSEITLVEKTRLHDQLVKVSELWNQDMQEWLQATVK